MKYETQGRVGRGRGRGRGTSNSGTRDVNGYCKSRR